MSRPFQVHNTMDYDEYGSSEGVEYAPDDSGGAFASPGSVSGPSSARHAVSLDDYDAQLAQLEAEQRMVERMRLGGSMQTVTASAAPAARTSAQFDVRLTPVGGRGGASAVSAAARSGLQGVDMLAAMASAPYTYTPSSAGTPASAAWDVRSSRMTAASPPRAPAPAPAPAATASSQQAAISAIPRLAAATKPRGPATVSSAAAAAAPAPAPAASAAASSVAPSGPLTAGDLNASAAYSSAYGSAYGTSFAGRSTAQLPAVSGAAAARAEARAVADAEAAARTARAEAGQLLDALQESTRQLAECNARLASREEYCHLVERRLLEVVPDHVLPVTDALLGSPIATLSKLAMAAAQTLTGTVTPGKMQHVASHVLARDAAARKETMEQAESLKKFERQLAESRAKLGDATRRIKELRGALDVKEKERNNALRRAEGLQTRIISLEAEMRLAGLMPAPASAATAVDVIATSTTAASLAGALAPAAAASWLDKSMIGTGSVPATVDELISRCRILEAELATARAARDAAQEAATKEISTTEEMRVQIGALERALQGRAAELGYGADSASLMTQLARISGELSARTRDSAAKDATIAELQSKLKEAHVQIADLAREAAVAAAAPISHRFASPSRSSAGALGGGMEAATPSRRGAATAASVVVRSPALGEISVYSHQGGAASVRSPGYMSRALSPTGRVAPPVAPLSVPAAATGPTTLPANVIDMIGRLEAEKGALLDYIAETRDALSSLSAQADILSAGKAAADAAAARSQEDADAAQREAADARADVAAAARNLADTQSRLEMAEMRLQDLQKQHAAATAKAARDAEEIALLQGTQEDLVQQIRESENGSQHVMRDAESFRRKLSDTQRKLESTESTLEHVEAERDAAENRVAELQVAIDSVTAEVKAARTAEQEARTEAAAAHAQQRLAESRVITLERQVESLSSAREDLQSRLDASESRGAAMSLEMDALQKTAASVAEAEATIAAFLSRHAGTDLTAPRGSGEGGADAGWGASDVDSAGSGAELEEEEDAEEAEAHAKLFDSHSGQAIRAPAATSSGGAGAGAGAGAGSSKHKRRDRERERDRSRRSRAAAEEASAIRALDKASEAGRSALQRAETALTWATDASLNSAAPQLSAAARQLSGWLRLSGVALTDMSRRIRTELEDKRMFRRMLQDEIHKLRDRVAEVSDALVAQTNRAAEAEGRVASLSRQRDSEVSVLTSQLNEASRERDAVRARAAELHASLTETAADAGRLKAREEALSAQLAAVTAARDDAAERAQRLNDALNAAITERDSLAHSLRRAEAATAEVTRAASVLETEKHALLDRLQKVEQQLREAQASAADLRTAVASARGEGERTAAVQAAVEAELTHTREALAAARAASDRAQQSAADKVTGLQQQLMGALDTTERQNELLEHLQGQCAALGQERSLLQRNVASLSAELENTKAGIDQAAGDLTAQMEAVTGLFRRLGVDVDTPLAAAAAATRSGADRGAVAAAAAILRMSDMAGAPGTSSTSQFSPAMAVLSKLRSLVGTHVSLGQAAGARISALLSEVTSYRNELSKMKPQVEAVQDVVASAQEKGRSLAAAEAVIADLRAALAAMESQLHLAQTEAASLKVKIGDQQAEVERASSRVAVLIRENEAARDGERRCAAMLADAETRIAQLEEELDHARKDQDDLVAQRARAEATSHREIGRMNELAAELATLNTQKARAEQALGRAQEQLAGVRQEAIDTHAQAAALTARVAELSELLASKDAEIADLRAQARQLAAMRAELEAQVARDVNVLTAETADALSSGAAAREALAVRSAEVESLRAQLEAARSSATATAAASSSGSTGDYGRAGSRSTSPSATARFMSSGTSAAQLASRYTSLSATLPVTAAASTLSGSGGSTGAGGAGAEVPTWTRYIPASTNSATSTPYRTSSSNVGSATAAALPASRYGAPTAYGTTTAAATTATPSRSTAFSAPALQPTTSSAAYFSGSSAAASRPPSGSGVASSSSRSASPAPAPQERSSTPAALPAPATTGAPQTQPSSPKFSATAAAASAFQPASSLPGSPGEEALLARMKAVEAKYKAIKAQAGTN